MKYDPVTMFEQKRSKFDRWVKKKLAQAQGEDEEDSESPRRGSSAKTQTKGTAAAPSKPMINKPQSARNLAPQKEHDDLINLNPSAPGDFGFDAFQSAPPQKDDGFGDFTGQPQPQNVQSTGSLGWG